MKKDINLTNEQIQFDHLTELLYQAYGSEAATLTMLWYVSSIFQDIILEKVGVFPLINFDGSVGTGKSSLAQTLISMLRGDKEIIITNEDTKLYPKKNSVFLFQEEFKDISFRMTRTVEFLMSSYDGHCIPKINDQGIMSSEIANCVCLINGNSLTAQSTALFSRTITALPMNTSPANIKSLLELKEFETKGLTNWNIEIIKYRKYFELEFEDMFDNCILELKNMMTKQFSSTKFIKKTIINYSILLTTYYLLKDKLTFPFTKHEMLQTFLNSIVFQSERIWPKHD